MPPAFPARWPDPLHDAPGPERLEQPGCQRQAVQFGRPGPCRVIRVVSGDERPAGHGRGVVPDVELAPVPGRAAHAADQATNGDDQPGLLADLAGQCLGVRFARLDAPAGDRPLPLTGLVAAPDQQQPPRAVLDHGAYAGYDDGGHVPKSREAVTWW